MPKPSDVAKAEKEDLSAKLKTEPPKARSRATVDERKLADLQTQLQEKADELFVMVTPLLPVTGVYGAENSPKGIEALLNVAKRRPGMLKALEKVADGVDFLELGRFLLGLAAAVQIDFGRLDPNALPAQITGVTKVMVEHFSDEKPDNPNVVMEPKHAKRFVPA